DEGRVLALQEDLGVISQLAEREGLWEIRAMSTITAVLEPDADGTLHLPVPEELKSAKVKVVATLEAAEPAASDGDPLLGIWQGDIVYNPGWDEPLEDFTEYME